MKILGLSGALEHDPSAALVIDGEVAAAAEEERFIRDKHAKGKPPYEAAKWCLEHCGVTPEELDYVAFPFTPISLFHKARWYYAIRHWYAPDKAFKTIFRGNAKYMQGRRKMLALMSRLGIDPSVTPFVPVEHHIAHASSAYHLSGFPEKTAIIGIDGGGEYATTFFGYGENGRIHTLKEFYQPESLGAAYADLTTYLGFEALDGEFRVMGMAPYGDPAKHDFSRLIDYEKSSFRINTRYLNAMGLRRYKNDGKTFNFTPALVDWLGPNRIGDEIDHPYIDYAASIQDLLEKVSLGLIDHYVGDIIRETGKVCFAGGVGLNVKLNQKIIDLPDVKELFVYPAAGDAGTAVGAATYVAAQQGDTVRPMEHAYLGPAFSNEDCIAACQNHPEKPKWRQLDDSIREGAEILATGHPLAWFQGRMEFGPRALGNRSILGNPTTPGIADRINLQIKFRERWRPFCPSMLDRVAQDILQTDHPAPYMTFSFEVAEHWKERIPEVVHVDGTARAQVVTPRSNPKYYRLIEALEKHTGAGVIMNTSLNRRGEPMVCSPEDALNMFFGSNLQYLIMEDVLVTK
jgi:carbamoyltransferase